MKNLFLAIVIAVVLINCFGAIVSDWWGVHLTMHDNLLTPIENFFALSFVAALLVIIGFVVALSLFGALAIGLGVAVFAIIVAGISALWPLLLIVGVLYLIRQRRGSYAS